MQRLLVDDAPRRDNDLMVASVATSAIRDRTIGIPYADL
jgi:hypothetical protein